MLSKNKIKYIQSLHQKKRRDEHNVFIAEGPKIVSEILDSSLTIQQIYAVDGEWLRVNQSNSKVEEISFAELRQISKLDAPNQVLAVVDKKPSEINDAIKISVLLDAIQDPGNLGTIIRIADWFGINKIIASKDTADEYNPKVVQSTMGSIARVKIYYTDLVTFLENRTIPVYAAMLNGDAIFNYPKIDEGYILIGNESKGIRETLLPFVDNKVTIPGRGKAESLNASVALGIVLSHLL